MKKELVYLLGYFYADGYLAGGKYPTIEILKSDSEDLICCLNKSGFIYTTKYRFRKNSKNEQAKIRISACNPSVSLFTSVMVDKINMHSALNTIDKKDLCYFLRGFFDGDGCITIGKNNHCRLYFYGSFDQNWQLVFDILQKLNIKFTYQKITRKNSKHKSSQIVISNKGNIDILYTYMYPDRYCDFGLSRKYHKLNLVASLIKRNHIKVHNIESSNAHNVHFT